MRLSQTSIIAASLMVAFIIFITVRGELPKYLAVLTGKAGTGTTPAATNPGQTAGINFSVSGTPFTDIWARNADADADNPNPWRGYLGDIYGSGHIGGIGGWGHDPTMINVSN